MSHAPSKELVLVQVQELGPAQAQRVRAQQVLEQKPLEQVQELAQARAQRVQVRSLVRCLPLRRRRSPCRPERCHLRLRGSR